MIYAVAISGTSPGEFVAALLGGSQSRLKAANPEVTS